MSKKTFGAMLGATRLSLTRYQADALCLNYNCVMKHNVELIVAKGKYFYPGLGWVLMMIVPWTDLPRPSGSMYLLFASDMFCLAIALTLFIFPGLGLYLYIKKYDNDIEETIGLLSIGFALSVLIVAALGLGGRVLGLSFVTVRAMFTLSGALILIFLLPRYEGAGSTISSFVNSSIGLLKNPPLLLALILSFLFSIHDYLFFLDDATYGAYLTNWQYSSQLGFQNLIHDPSTTEHIRFWLALFPMSQALIADLSGIPGLLLLGNYLELLLVPLSVLTLYWCGQKLGLSHRASGFSVLVQVVLFVYIQGIERPIGRWFYQSLSEDKVAAVFLLSPVLFIFVINYLRGPTRRNLLLVLLCGFGLMLTHPVILLMACIISLGVSVLAWCGGLAPLRCIAPLGIVFVLVMSPFMVIRAIDNAGHFGGPYNVVQVADTYEIDLYVNIINEKYYGINPGVLEFSDLPLDGSAHELYQLVRTLPIIILLAGCALALTRIKQAPLSWYIASVNGTIFLALLPYTGWMLGLFTSARLLYRIAWFAPLGFSFILLLLSMRGWLIGRIGRGSTSRLSFLGLLLCVLLATPTLIFTVIPRVPAYFQLLTRNHQLSQIGVHIDSVSNKPETVIALDYSDLQLIPTISSRSLLISFREEQEYNGFNNFMSLQQVHDRIEDSNILRSLDSDVPSSVRCELLRKHEVKYVLVREGHSADYKKLIQACGMILVPDFVTDDYILFRVE